MRYMSFQIYSKRELIHRQQTHNWSKPSSSSVAFCAAAPVHREVNREYKHGDLRS